MTPEELRHWRVEVMKFRSQTEAGKALGYKLSRYCDMEMGRAGEQLHPCIALACAALAAGLEPWPIGTEHEELPLETAIRKTRPAKKVKSSKRRGSTKQKAATRPQQSPKKKKPAARKKRTAGNASARQTGRGKRPRSR